MGRMYYFFKASLLSKLSLRKVISLHHLRANIIWIDVLNVTSAKI